MVIKPEYQVFKSMLGQPGAFNTSSLEEAREVFKYFKSDVEAIGNKGDYAILYRIWHGRKRIKYYEKGGKEF